MGFQWFAVRLEIWPCLLEGVQLERSVFEGKYIAITWSTVQCALLAALSSSLAVIVVSPSPIELKVAGFNGTGSPSRALQILVVEDAKIALRLY